MTHYSLRSTIRGCSLLVRDLISPRAPQQRLLFKTFLAFSPIASSDPYSGIKIPGFDSRTIFGLPHADRYKGWGNFLVSDSAGTGYLVLFFLTYHRSKVFTLAMQLSCVFSRDTAKDTQTQARRGQAGKEPVISHFCRRICYKTYHHRGVKG